MPVRMPRFRTILPLLIAAGCASRYEYVPTTNATASMQGNVAADYPVPANAPQGDVRIASYGITDVSPKSSPNEIHRALHLRIVMADNGSAPWTFDTREQRLDLNGHGPIAPAFASANSGAPPPLVTVEPNAKRIVNLFFCRPRTSRRATCYPSLTPFGG